MTIAEIIDQRRIAEVLHYTTNHGLVGILATSAVKPRERLPEEKYLEHVYHPACKVRRDAAWFGYVNLSISRINASLFGIASGKWHRNRDVWWCVLGFDPVILTHAGVVFTTTNNMYSGVIREQGAAGLGRLFGQRIHRYESHYVNRPKNLPDRFPTCAQAEALYPGDLSTQHLRNIFVATEDHYDTVFAQCAALAHDSVPIMIRPKAFE